MFSLFGKRSGFVINFKSLRPESLPPDPSEDVLVQVQIRIGGKFPHVKQSKSDNESIEHFTVYESGSEIYNLGVWRDRYRMLTIQLRLFFMPALSYATRCFSRLLITQTDCDVFFTFPDGSKFGAHAAFLKARSERFMEMLKGPSSTGENKQISVKDCSGGSFVAFLDFVYTGRLTSATTVPMTEELAKLAEEYKMEDLKMSIERYLSRKPMSHDPRDVRDVEVYKSSAPLQELCRPPTFGDFCRSFCGEDN